MSQYTFTTEQLFKLLQETAILSREYTDTHGYGPTRANAQAALDTIEGLDEERGLFDQGELKPEQLTQTYPGVACPKCYADYMQSGIENL